MIIDGKKLAEEALPRVSDEVKKLTVLPKLAAILVGHHPGSRRFLELKKKAAEKIGINFALYEFPEEISTKQLIEEVRSISANSANTGVIVELPLPALLETQKVLDVIPVEKDADVLSAESQGFFFSGQSKVLPPAVEAVKLILQQHQIDPKGKNCAVFGYGLLVGRPISHWLAGQGATVWIINEFTNDPGAISSKADILISGVGQSNLVTREMVKDGAVVIDFGYENRDGLTRGDVSFEEVSRKAALITPVPGGVGPLVVVAVLKNLVILASLSSYSYQADSI